MKIQFFGMLRRAAVGAVFAVLLAGGAAAVGVAAEEPVTPSQVATHFLHSFAANDLETVQSLFAPGALVQRARLSPQGGDPELASFQAQPWAEESVRGASSVKDFKIEVLETEETSFGEGVTVNVRFQATGEVGNGMAFVNDGVDSFSMVQIDGSWRILLYNSFERFKWKR